MTEEAVAGPEALDGYPDPGPEPTDGHPDEASQADAGHPDSQTDPQSESAAVEVGNWEQRYKDLQSHQTRRDQELAQTRQSLEIIQNAFDQYGGIQGGARILNTVMANPDIRSILERQSGKQDAPDPVSIAREVGLDPADEEQITALNVMNRIVERSLKPLMEKNQAYEDRIRQLESGIVQERTKGLAEQMTQKHPGWESYREQMEKLAANLSPDVASNPSLETLEALYGAALIQRGELEKVGESVYRKKLEGMKQKSVDKPRAGGPLSDKAPGSTLEALKLAMKQHGSESLLRY